MILKRARGETSDSLANPMGAEWRKPRSQSVLGAAIGAARAIGTRAIGVKRPVHEEQ